MDVRRTAAAVAAGIAVTGIARAGCAPAADTAGGPVTLEFWAWGSGIDTRVTAWNQARPDIQVTVHRHLEQLPAALHHARLPDLVPITVAMYLMLNRGGSEPVLYSLAIAGSAVAIVPVIAFVLILQRFWRLDLVSGSIK
jgi:hypothetical protein